MIEIIKPTKPIQTQIQISGSKSLSNRLLLLNQILEQEIKLQNCSDSEDTKNLISSLKIIQDPTSKIINVHHAGSNMRFLTAYLSTLPGEWILTGSERMKQRPISELVNALQQIGAHIEYTEKQGFPPLKINGETLVGGKIKLKANISSQYISALILIAPKLPHGLELELEGEIVSKPYIQMTISILKDLGITIEETRNQIKIHPIVTDFKKFNHKAPNFLIESDWSSASYWYSVCALTKNSKIELSTLFKNSLQADSVLPKLYENLGVTTTYSEGKVMLKQTAPISKYFEYNFINCPDIAQTIAVTCFGLGIEAKLNGLSTLKIKETDRILALKTELEKLGAKIVVNDSSIHLLQNSSILPQSYTINTYNDHRMALSFAPLALIVESIKIKDESVIDKSYGHFWQDLKSAGFSVNLTP